MKKSILLFFALLVALPGFAQVNAGLTPPPAMQFLDSNGNPLSGGCLFSYQAGSSTPLATYSDSTGSSSNPNPIMLNAAGYPTNSSGSVTGVWLGPQKYRLALYSSGGSQCATGSQQWNIDNVSGNNLFSLANVSLAESTAPSCSAGNDILWADSSGHRFKMCNNGGSADTVVGAATTDTLTNKTMTSPTLNTPAINSGAFSGTQTGTAVFGGTTSTKNLNNIQFADQFTGADASAKIQAAITALPTNGGIVDARNLTDVGGTGSTTIDPGSKSVTILLGPYTYNISQIVIRTNLHVIGMGSGAGLSSSKPPTLIQATGNDSTAPFVLSQTVSEGQEGVVLRGFRLFGKAGNVSQNGIFISAPAGGGLWYSEFDDIEIQDFGGIDLDFESSTASGINQFSTFKRIVAFRTSGGSYALQIKGFNNSLKFENCEFDGNPVVAGGDGLTNINITDTAGGTFPPYNIKFDLVTTQWAGVGFQINGADTLSIDQGHFEGVFGAIALGTGASFGSLNITVHDTGFFNNTGINGGNGYIVNNAGATANVSASIIDSHVYPTPDTFLKGNTGSILSFGNVIGPEGTYAFQPWHIGSSIYFPEITAPSALANNDICYGDSTAHGLKCSYNNGTFFKVPQTIGSGTATMTTALIASAACGTTVTVAATGVLTTDSISWAYNAAPLVNPAELVISAWPTADNVNFQYCNPTGAGVTPNAATLNWRVTR